jgi:hypothetical protein
VDAAFLAALRESLENPDRIVRAAQRPLAAPHSVDRDVVVVRRELERLDRREANLVRLHTTGQVSEGVYRSQAAEIATLRNAATERLAALDAAVEAAKHAKEHAADLAAAVKAIRARVKRATFAEWRRLVEQLFPRQPGTWIRLHPSGRIETHGLLRLGGKRGTGTSGTPQFPIRVAVG